MLIKRQNASKYRKAELRHELQKRKENLLKNAYDHSDRLDFPEISPHQMNVLKQEIRDNLKRERRRSIRSYGLAIGLIVLFFVVVIAILKLAIAFW
jgi:hypothetical protein